MSVKDAFGFGSVGDPQERSVAGTGSNPDRDIILEKLKRIDLALEQLRLDEAKLLKEKDNPSVQQASKEIKNNIARLEKAKTVLREQTSSDQKKLAEIKKTKQTLEIAKWENWAQSAQNGVPIGIFLNIEYNEKRLGRFSRFVSA